MNAEVIPVGIMEPLARAKRDIKKSAAELGPREARYLVDLYYQVQEYRKRAANQERASDEDAEPVALVGWTFDAFKTIEATIKTSMGIYAQAHRPGRWAMSQVGIGPIIAAGLLAHIDIEKAPSAGNIWSFAGLVPGQDKLWTKGTKRPWNARLKVLCWKIGDSFVKQSGRDGCVYGHYYRDRKAIEVHRNETGEYAEIAARTLEERKFKDKPTRTRYEEGRLPDGRIDLRARRSAVKLFLAHLHHAMYESRFGEPPRRPYHVAETAHGHYIAPYGWPVE